MKTITETFNLYKFKELSDKSKAKSLDKWFESGSYPWDAENEKVLDKFVENFDFIGSTNWSYGNSVYSPHGECEIDTPYEYEDIELEDLAGLELYRFIQNYMDKFKVYKTYTLNGENIYTAKKKCQSKIKWEYSNECQLTGYWLDCEIMQPIFNYIENFPKHQNTTLGEIMNECIAFWASHADGDVEQYYSEEYLEERSNDFDEYYYEDGAFYGQITDKEVA